MNRLVVSVGIVCCQAAYSAPSPERVFADAQDYTVYIETRIEAPFIEDSQRSSFGAGFVIDVERHWLLTNAHVSGHSPAHITAMFDGGETVRAWPIYIDPYLDIAILEYDATVTEPIQQARMECTTSPRTGHPVGAFGHPNGFKFTGTRGVVSGQTYRFGADWLQTDAPINGGNSGGPLISLTSGRVIGINTATLKDDGSQNANFAVKANQACRVIELLERGGDPRPTSLGVSFFRKGEEDTLEVAQAFSIGMENGLHRGDVILGLAGVAELPTSEGQLIHLLRSQASVARLRVLRAGNTIELSTRFPRRIAPLDRRGVRLGGAVFASSNQIDTQRFVSVPELMVHSVAPGSAAEMAGMEPYDHLVAVDGNPVTTLEDLVQAVSAYADEGGIILELVRVNAIESQFGLDVLAEIPAEGLEAVGFTNAPGRSVSQVR